MSSTYPDETNGGSITSYVPSTTAWPLYSGCVGPLTCPESWSTVATSTKSESSTLAMCCPPGYSLKSCIPGQITGDCLSDVTSGMASAFASTPVHPSTTTFGSKSYVKRADSSTTLTSSTPSPTSPPESDATAVPLSQSSGGRQLSTGAYVGIGLGASVGVIGIITLLLVLRVLHRNQNAPNTFQQSTLATTEVPHNHASFMSGNRDRGRSFERAGKPLSMYFPGYSARNAGRPPAGLV